MSGHSKWATIHRQKEVKDATRGRLFSKLARAISIAVKTGGGVSPESNFKLRVAVDAARAANMPKANIDRAIAAGSGEGATLEEVVYEGFGPEGIAIMVASTTDNRNRTSAEIRNLFEKNGGKFAGAGAVAFNFEPKGLLLVKKEADPQSQMLKLIDLGVQEMEEEADGIEVYVPPRELYEVRDRLLKNGQVVISAELTQKAKAKQSLEDEKEKKVLAFLEKLGEHDDVDRVYTNLG